MQSESGAMESIEVVLQPTADLLIIKKDSSVAPVHMITLSGLKMVVYKRKNECVLKSRNENKGLTLLSFYDEPLRIARQMKYKEFFKGTDSSRRSNFMKRPFEGARAKRLSGFFARSGSPETSGLGDQLERELRRIGCGVLETKKEIRLRMG